MTSHRLSHAIWLAGFLALSAVSAARAMPAPAGPDTPLTVDDAPRIRLAQAQPAPSPSPSPQAPDASAPAPDASVPADQSSAPEEPIGNVASLTGVATVIRDKNSIALKLKDDIYLNDTVQTAASSTLGITFSDATTFHLSANAKITIDTYVYEENGGSNAGVFDIAKGTVAFVAAQVAKTGNMQITTPTATLGIRGTTGVIDVPDNVAAASANNVNIKLYPDADGRVGHIDVNDRQGGRLGALTQGASGFSIRPGTSGARFAAVPLTISPQQQTRDQGFVRQVHATQTTGRQIVAERRDFRRANPTYVNPNAPRRQGGLPAGQTRPGQPGQPGQNRPSAPGQQPATPNGRQGQQQQQRPGQPGQPARPGQTTTPANPNRPGATPRPGPTTPTQPGTTPRSGQNGQPTTPREPGATPQPGRSTLPATPGQPGTTPRPGQNTQPGTTPRPGRNGLPTTPSQPGAPRSGQNGQPAVPSQPNAPPRQAGPPPLPPGQPLLRQPGGPGRPQFAPGNPRPGFQNRPAAPRPRQGQPPKDKKHQNS